MISVNSISGGKTSAYMAVHYPADYNVFACVLIDDPSCSPKDKGLVKAVGDKLGREFVATAERDDTLRVVLDMEQITGQPVTWVAGMSFDSVVRKMQGKKGLPNRSWRYCTTEMKMRPIWDWWYANVGEIIQMRVGIRHDEKERAERLTTTFKGIVGKRGTLNKWEEVEWRTTRCPLVEDGIDHFKVAQWAKTTTLPFPQDSNCIGCFWKPIQQLRKNWDEEPMKMEWFASMEEKRQARWKNEITYNQIKGVGLQSEFAFGTGAGCQGGFCTD